MSTYKNTLNLPKTSFSMKANLAKKEPERLKKWIKNNIYENIRNHFNNSHKFILHDGPPYANGYIHIGHAVNKILKDIIIRSKTLSGFDAPYVPGWDCHGLPIELQVEKNLSKTGGGKVNSKEFRKSCRKYAISQVIQQSQDFQRLGILGDWKHPYLTMNFNYEANIIRTLAKIIDKKHLVQGIKPVHWCTDCRSVLAEAEVEYKDKNSFAIDVKFNIDNSDVSQVFNINNPIKYPTFVVIWTTTPWTLPANQAIAIHQDIIYVLVNIRDQNIIVSERLLKSLMIKINIDKYQIISKIQGSQLTRLEAKHPFYNKIVPIIPSDHVSIESGTGLVHIAPAHGIEDFKIGKKYHLSLDNLVDESGYYMDQVPVFSNKFIFDSNQIIINYLLKNDALLYSENIKHSYPYCWRHNKPLIFRVSSQWFISMHKNNLQEKAEKAINKIKWMPIWGKNRITKMIQNRPDWCISRQRTWGVPMPLFVNKNTGKLHPNTVEITKKVANLIEKKGIESWFNSNNLDFIEKDEINHYERVHDILDVWFDSGASHSCVLQKNKLLNFPADLYLEGSDQHRGWFQSSLLISIACSNKIPSYQVLTHGFVVDDKGRKMSKSLGNTISPQTIVNDLGADILRLWVASTDYQSEMNISKDILKHVTDIYRRIRNTARFLLSNLQDFNLKTDILKFNKLVAIDQWAIIQTKKVQEDIIKDYNNYNFHMVVQHIHHFCSIEMGSFYLEIIKDRQYTASTKGNARKSSQNALYHILQALVRWISPILCFTADEIWESITFENSQELVLCQWYDKINCFELFLPFTLEYWKIIKKIRDECNKLIEEKRTRGEIGGSLEIEMILYVNKILYRKLLPISSELHFALIVSKVFLKPSQNKTSSALVTSIPGLFVELTKSSEKKCERCWHYCHSIGKNLKYHDICSRCIKNITTEKGENREFV